MGVLDEMKIAGGKGSSGTEQTAETRTVKTTKITCVACGKMTPIEEIARRSMCPACVCEYEEVEGGTEDTTFTHPTTIPGWDGTLKELAQAVENLRYDMARDFVYELSQAFRERALVDREAGKWWLAGRLSKASGSLGSSHYWINRAWEICKPHMPPAKDG